MATSVLWSSRPVGAFVTALFFAAVALFSSGSLVAYIVSSGDVSPAPVVRELAAEPPLVVRSPFGAVITQQSIDLIAEQVAFLSENEPGLVGRALSHFAARTDCVISAELNRGIPVSSAKRGYDWVGLGDSGDHHVAVRAKGCA